MSNPDRDLVDRHEWRRVGSSRLTPPNTVTVWQDDNPEVGRILGPKGELLRIVRAKSARRVGFRPDL